MSIYIYLYIETKQRRITKSGLCVGSNHRQYGNLTHFTILKYKGNLSPTLSSSISVLLEIGQSRKYSSANVCSRN